ncbi:MAG TPA: MFS transporter, partial [Bacillales bacterium]|nr:MFS transporter [Bacillales bacterium]
MNEDGGDNKNLKTWIGILVFGVGVSSIGDFIYLVALNIFVWEETHSAAAVAGLWVVSRIAALFVGPWAGSVTDRLPHRKQLIGLEVARALLIGSLPLLSNLYLIYSVLFLLGICGTFFGNAFL